MSSDNLLILANLVQSKVKSNPHLDILTFEHQGASDVRTYAQLWENGQKLAAALSRLGLAKGDRFGLLIQNHPEFVELMIASSLLATVFVPIDPRTQGQKLAHMLKDSDCKGVICADYSIHNIDEILGVCPQIQWLATIGSDLSAKGGIPLYSVATMLDAPLPSPMLGVAVQDETEPMQMMYTSGTTGDPKGIVVPYARFGAVSNHGEAVFGYRHGDRPYTGLSLTHGNAQFVTLAPSLKMELRAVFSRKFTKSRLWDIIRHYGCTTFSLLGGMVTAIFAEPVKDNDSDNPVRLVISAGMPAAIWEEFASRFDLDIFEFYGAMEGGMTIKPVGEGPIGSCGRVAPGLKAKVIDEQGAEVSPGALGELVFQMESGPFPPVTYHKNPEASAKKVQDGWLLTGDIVRMDANGWVFYEYRKGGGIRRNGEFISPAAIEKTLALNASVTDVFVYGVPAANNAPGEKDVVAAVTLTNPADTQALIAWAKTQLEANMVPSFIQVVDEIPKTASEKPQERFLVQMFEDDPASVCATS